MIMDSPLGKLRVMMGFVSGPNDWNRHNCKCISQAQLQVYFTGTTASVFHRHNWTASVFHRHNCKCISQAQLNCKCISQAQLNCKCISQAQLNCKCISQAQLQVYFTGTTASYFTGTTPAAFHKDSTKIDPVEKHHIQWNPEGRLPPL